MNVLTAQTFKPEELLKLHRSNYDSVSRVLKESDWIFVGRRDTGKDWALFEWKKLKYDQTETLLIDYATVKQLLYATANKAFFDSSLAQLKLIFKDYKEVETVTDRIWIFQNGSLMQIKASYENRRKPKRFGITFTSIFQEPARW